MSETTATTATTTAPAERRPHPTVTDATGKVWKLVFTVNLIKPLEEVVGHNPRELLTDPEKLVAFLSDPERVAAAAYTLTEPVPLGVIKAGREEFAAALDSDGLDEAAEGVIRQVAEMYAPRGRKQQVADALIAALLAAGTAKAADVPAADVPAA